MPTRMSDGRMRNLITPTPLHQTGAAMQMSHHTRAVTVDAALGCGLAMVSADR